MFAILLVVLVALVIASPFIGLGLCCWALGGADVRIEAGAGDC